MPFPNPDTQFKSGAEWKGNADGRPDGSKSRKTILRDVADAIVPYKPLGSDESVNMPAEYAGMIALMRKVMEGDIPAIKEMQDTLYGKNPDILAGDKDNPLFPTATEDSAALARYNAKVKQDAE